MGIRGLTTFCHKNEAQTSTHCAELRDVTLAVDCVGFLYDTCELLYKQVQNAHARQLGGGSGNTAALLSPQAWLLLGGGPDLFEQYLEQWFAVLRASNISLVFVTDPPQCFGGEDHRKSYCQQERALRKANKIRELGSTLFVPPSVLAATDSSAGMAAAVVSAGTTTTPSSPAAASGLRLAQTESPARLLQEINGCFPFAREKLRCVLKRHGVRIQTATREADEELAELVRSQQAFAVLARDSDFLCMRGVRYIPFAKLHIDYTRQRVSARVFTPERVAAALKLSVEQLVDLALVCSNDLTPLLDVEFGMATRLNFPVQRVLTGANTVFPKEAAQWIARQLPIIDNPVLRQIEAETPGLLRALYEIYRFYGHSAAFLQRYPLEIEPAIAAHKLALYTQLLDEYEYPTSSIDVLETRVHAFSNRFDPLAVAGKSTAVLLAPLRQLEYAALGVAQVAEFTTGDENGRLVRLACHDFLADLLAQPIASRSLAAVSDVLRDLVLTTVFGTDASRINDATKQCARLERMDVQMLAYALLVLQRRDEEYLHERPLLDHRRIEILLLTSLICLNAKSTMSHQGGGVALPKTAASMTPNDVHTDEQSIEWGLYATVNAYVRALKQLFHVRVILGEPQPMQCATFFSPDVFVRVCDSLSGGKGVQEAWRTGASSQRVISKERASAALAHCGVELVGSTEMLWRKFWDLRLTMSNLKRLLPRPQVIRTATVPPVVIAAPTATPSAGANGRTRGASANDAISIRLGSMTITEVVTEEPPMAATAPPTTATVAPVPVTVPRLPPTAQAPPAVKPSSLLTPAAVVKHLGAKTNKKYKAKAAKNGVAAASPRSTASSASASSSAAVRTNTATNGSSAASPPTASDSPQTVTNLSGLMATLPVFQHRHEILENVANNQITIIQGETGCGKSTSVPQFLLDAALRSPSPDRPVNIYVTQPRRIAAIELANTVAGMRAGNEFNEDGRVGGVIGYRIGQKQLVSSRTKITYVTTGYMVERLIHDPNALASMTHLVLDEVHERSMDVDLLLLLLRLQLNDHPHVRLVIMSATMDAKVILKYFADALTRKLVKKKPLFVGSKLFPVTHVFLDALEHRFPSLRMSCRKEIALIQGKIQGLVDARERANSEVAVARVSAVLDKQLPIVVELIKLLISASNRAQHAQCILVFLPGIGAINTLFETLSVLAATTTTELVAVYVLHSALELEHQQEAFRTIAQRSTKIILSTNIAESSVTIPDVTHVINCGVEKQIDMPNAGSSHAEVLIDSWCSQASAKQRAGRAGRVMPGTAFHLFTEDFYERCMLPYSTPEMLRKPLDRIILLLKGKMEQFGTPSELLTQAMDAPELASIDGAYKLLAHFDAVDSPVEKTAKMTTFGAFVCHLPLNLHLCRLVMIGMYLVQGRASRLGLSATTVAAPTDASTSETSPDDDRGVPGAAGPSEPPPQGESWQLLLHVVILAAVLGVPDLFLSPSFYHASSASKYLREMKASLRAKLDADASGWSEPLAIWRLYLEVMVHHTPTKRANLGVLCHRRAISLRRFQTLNFLISDLCNRLVTLQRNDTLGAFSALLDSKSIAMLMWLDAYASSQRVDDNLLNFAVMALSGRDRIEDVLRFLLVHNYDEHLIGGVPELQAQFKDDDLSGLDRVDLKVDSESFGLFSKMKSKLRVEMFEQLASDDTKSSSAASASPSAEFAAIAYDSRTVSLYTFASGRSSSSSASANDAPVAANGIVSQGYDHVLPRMSFPVSLLYYVRDQRFPVDFGVASLRNDGNNNGASSSNESKVRVRVGDCNGSSVSWVQQKDNVKVSLSGRNLLSLPVRLGSDNSDGDNDASLALSHQKLHAVYAERMFTGSEARMYCSKCTLLPPDSVSYYPMILLLGARRTANVWLYVNDMTREIVTIKVDGHVVVLPPKTGIRLAIVDAVNVVRRALSDALNAAADGARVNVTDLLALADDSNFVVKGSKAKCATFSWRQARMPELDKAVLQDFAARGVAPPRFPPLQLV